MNAADGEGPRSKWGTSRALGRRRELLAHPAQMNAAEDVPLPFSCHTCAAKRSKWGTRLAKTAAEDSKHTQRNQMQQKMHPCTTSPLHAEQVGNTTRQDRRRELLVHPAQINAAEDVPLPSGVSGEHAAPKAAAVNS